MLQIFLQVSLSELGMHALGMHIIQEKNSDSLNCPCLALV